MRVVVFGRDSVTSKLLRFVLTDIGHQVMLAPSTADTLRSAIGSGADAVLLQTEPIAGDSYELCKELRSRGYNGPLLFISQSGETTDKLYAFECGADDFIVKPFDPRELIARVDSAARRFRRADRQALGTIIRVGDAELSVGELTFRIDGLRPVLLTPTEMRLLECLMRNPSVTISREILIDRVWSTGFVGDSNRVDVFIGRLRKKVERDAARPEYIRTVRGIGYVFRRPSRPSVLQLSGAQDSPAAMPRAHPI